MKKLFFAMLFLSHFLFGFSQSHPTEKKLFIPPLPEMSYAQVTDKSKFNGDRWSYMESGLPNAPTIVTLHGYGGSSVDWRYQLHYLSDKFHVIAWNAPGYMLSDGLKTEYPFGKDYADAVADFLDALKLDKVYLVGNSFGTAVAQSFAYHYPERVIKMVLLGPLAGQKRAQEAKIAHIDFRKAQIADGGYAFANKRVEALLAPNSSPELIELARKGMRGVHPNYFMRTLNFLMAEDHLPEIIAQKATMPVLLIAGTEDKITPITLNAEPLKKHFKDARLEVLQGVAHLPHLEAYKVVNQMIRDFLK